MRRIHKYNFGILSSFNKAIESARGIGRLSIQPSDETHHTTGHTNFRFDEESSEWQALITKNSYESNIFMNLDMPQLQNFGTVDNPHYIYTSEVPFRFVACAGPPSEDDFESHEVMWFMLREGPLQRCFACGQVFKLIKLREEFSAENDYYVTGLTHQTIDEFGDADVWNQTSLFRPFMFFTGEHTHFEVPSNYIYSLMRMDEHDRYLTDPAFRLEKNQQAEETYATLVNTMHKLDQNFKDKFGSPPETLISKDQYENLMETEKAIEVLNQHFHRVQRFQTRMFIDPKNHDRREKRMLKRIDERYQQNVIFFNDMTEERAQYNDYYETDTEMEKENLLPENVDLDFVVQSRDSNKLSNFDFHERYTSAFEQDAQSLLEKFIFKYKYRMARDDVEDFKRKENRRLDAVSNWYNTSDYIQNRISIENYQLLLKSNDLNSKQITFVEEDLELATKKKTDLEIELGMLNYESYFESDIEEETNQGISLGSSIDMVRRLPNSQKLSLSLIIDPFEENRAQQISLTEMGVDENPDRMKEAGLIGYMLEEYRNLQMIENITTVIDGVDYIPDYLLSQEGIKVDQVQEDIEDSEQTVQVDLGNNNNILLTKKSLKELENSDALQKMNEFYNRDTKDEDGDQTKQ